MQVLIKTPVSERKQTRTLKRPSNGNAFDGSPVSELQKVSKTMITPAQAAEMLGASTSTVRRWASEFEPFLEPRRGKKRLYTPGDIATFGRIKDLFAQGLTTDQIKRSLPLVEQPSPKGEALITIPDFARALEITMAKYSELQARLEAQADLIQELQGEIKALKEQGKPWYSRLFSTKKQN